MKCFVQLLFVVFALILGILTFVLKRKHSNFPDFRVGYHDKRIMENKQKWDYANNMAGSLCAAFAVVNIAVSALLYFVKASIEMTIIIFLLLSVISIIAILAVPIKLSKKSDKF